MLYKDFNAKKRTDGEDIFTSRIDNDVVQNLNPKFELRESRKGDSPQKITSWEAASVRK